MVKKKKTKRQYGDIDSDEKPIEKDLLSGQIKRMRE